MRDIRLMQRIKVVVPRTDEVVRQMRDATTSSFVQGFLDVGGLSRVSSANGSCPIRW